MGATVSDKDACRRWIIAISQLKSRAAKVRRGGVVQDTPDLVEQSLSLCDAIVRDLAGAGLQLDETRTRLETQVALWTHLFDEMPTACVETDASGVILGSNPAAAVLFNTSVKHLTARLLMHFAEDRDQFGQLLRGLSAESVRHRCALIIRPRERAPVHMGATVVVRSPGDVSSWLWFFTPLEQHEPAARRHRVPVETVQQTAGLPT
jgi:PAS domain-containing protein